MRALIIDGYVDEPGNLGVPPFFGIYPRYLAGAAMDAGAECDYVTIDRWREGEITVGGYDAIAIVGGTAVPGKYLTTMPASKKEMEKLVGSLGDTNIILAGPASDVRDPLAKLHDILREGEYNDREMTNDEWNKWAVLGTAIVKERAKHYPTIAEIETYRGCVRYICGGCDFCIEPSKGRPRYREPKDIIAEISALYEAGMRNFRLGGQTCIFSYMAEGVGETETPTPDPQAMEELLKGVHRVAPKLGVLHVDNGNPAVIANHLKEAREVARLLVEYCTSGNVVALGLESADPIVAKENNLNTNAEETLVAIKMINEEGAMRGKSGLPKLLPGINFLGGLKGERKDTYNMNIGFLEGVMNADLLLRRINIRQVNWPDSSGGPFNRSLFIKFKEQVRDSIDQPMLRKILPEGTILRDVYLEIADGKTVFGRQIGTYPLLVGVPYEMDLEQYVDIAITSHGKRSVTGVAYPLDVNNDSIRALEALPGVGRKRATRIFHKRPIKGREDLLSALEEEEVVDRILPFLNV